MFYVEPPSDDDDDDVRLTSYDFLDDGDEDGDRLGVLAAHHRLRALSMPEIPDFMQNYLPLSSSEEARKDEHNFLAVNFILLI